MIELLQNLHPCLFLLAAVVIFIHLAYNGIALWAYSIFFTICLLYYSASELVWGIFIIFNITLLIKPIRRLVFTNHIIKLIKALNALPKISKTEETALRAGDTWIETELFSGKPNFDRIYKEPYNSLSKAEDAFVNNQVNTICEMTNDWEVFANRDLPEKTWDYLKKEKFFGMIIPKKYGGLEFSALGNSSVVAKLATRSQVLAITVMVPNSLGPAELLLHYGTKKQKEYYLPRLAKGEEIPCFALTEPTAGSDATSIKAEGIVFKDKDKKIKIKLNFRKRYITLGAKASVIGLAFKLKDPKNLLKKGIDRGISCALIKNTLEGVSVERRHDPLNVPFINSPVVGKNVVIGLDDIIGGESQIGEGWKMLIECLSVGRGISLPATSTGGSEFVTRVVANYSLIRKQFGLPIGKFEGVQAKMAELAGFSYMLDAARVFTASSIDSGYKPAVANAIAKYHFTEKFREVVNHGMDILGGAAICRGPRNLLAHAYLGTPIAITVEGSNVMTRSLIHFGQGAIRCHPYSYDEMKALMSGDNVKFDHYFFKHIGHLFRNKIRSIILSLTRGRFHFSTQTGVLARYESKLAWASSSFALYSDIALAMYGGSIKRKEQINGRFGDILSAMYFATCLMRRYIAEGKKKEDLDYLKWGMEYCFNNIQIGFTELYKNLSPGIMGKLIRFMGGFYNRINPIGSYPSDKLTQKIATSLISDKNNRDHLANNVFFPSNKDDHFVKLEKCFTETLKGDVIMKKIKTAILKGTIDKNSNTPLKNAFTAKIITKDEMLFLESLEKLQLDCIEVDSFMIKDYLSHKMKKPYV